MDDREPRPTAKTRALSYTFAPENGSPINILEMSITGCRLAVLRGASDEHIAQVVVWDWITGQILLVYRLLIHGLTLVLIVRSGARERILPLCEFY